MTRHTVFREREKSPCRWHRGLCAYTGQEPDRCPYCHARKRTILKWGDNLADHMSKELKIVNQREANR